MDRFGAMLNLWRGSGEALDEIESIGIGVLSLINLVNEQQLDTVFFLDKSARPIGVLFNKTWRKVFPEVRCPDIRFANIGREPVDKESISESVAEFKGAFGSAVTNKRVGIIDEYVDTGGSLMRAKALFESSFPLASKFIYTSVLPECAKWHGSKGHLGVLDKGRAYFEGVWEDYADASFISTTYVAQQEHPEFKAQRASESDHYRKYRESYAKHKQAAREKTLELRKQLSYFASTLAKHVKRVPMGSFETHPFIPDDARKAQELQNQYLSDGWLAH